MVIETTNLTRSPLNMHSDCRRRGHKMTFTIVGRIPFFLPVDSLASDICSMLRLTLDELGVFFASTGVFNVFLDAHFEQVISSSVKYKIIHK